MYYKIKDLQIAGRYFADGDIFPSKEEVYNQLIDYHSIDWDDDMEILESLKTLEDVLSYGEWEIEEITALETLNFIAERLYNYGEDITPKEAQTIAEELWEIAGKL